MASAETTEQGGEEDKVREQTPEEILEDKIDRAHDLEENLRTKIDLHASQHKLEVDELQDSLGDNPSHVDVIQAGHKMATLQMQTKARIKLASAELADVHSMLQDLIDEREALAANAAAEAKEAEE